MSARPKLQTGWLVVLAVLASGTAVQADTFGFQFLNNSFSGVVGTGTFSYTGHVGNGPHLLTTLPNYTLNFTVGSSSWTNADIVTPLSAIEVVLYNNGNNMYFSNTGLYALPPAPMGSIDFLAGNTALTFEPPYYGAPPLDLYQVLDSRGNFYFSVFAATAVPEPASALTLLLGVGVLTFAFAAPGRRNRR